MDLQVPSADPRPVDEAGVRWRVPLTGLALLEACLGLLVAIPLLVAHVLSVVFAPLGLGLLLARVVVPATEAVAGLHRRLAGVVLGEPITAGYRPTSGGLLTAPGGWARDPARWRDLAYLCFSATGGLLMSFAVVALVVHPVVSIVIWGFQPGLLWTVLTLTVGSGCVVGWYFVTPALVRARALADRGILSARADELERRVEQVTASRAQSLDHSAAEIRRIERDLHDGAQARIVSLGMNLGLAEQLLATDPEAAAALLREARDSTVSALADLRGVVRGIHPPVLADRGLSGAVEALALTLSLPVTVSDDLGGARPPAPVESALYFGIVEGLTNAVKHGAATRAWVRLTYDGRALLARVGDDGHGGVVETADGGVAGVRRRLAAFDGTVHVESPTGGPTVLSLEVPCALSSRRTTPSSATDSPGS